jgi:hypothetical protein
MYIYIDIYPAQGWELTSLVHELFQQERELSRESVPINSGSRAQDRFNKVQLNKDLMIREPCWTTNEPTQNQANSGELLHIVLEHQLFHIWKTGFGILLSSIGRAKRTRQDWSRFESRVCHS